MDANKVILTNIRLPDIDTVVDIDVCISWGEGGKLV